MLNKSIKALLLFSVLALIGAGSYLVQETLLMNEPVKIPLLGPVTNDMRQASTSTRKILMVVAPVGVRDEEYFIPRSIFAKAGYSVTVASIQSGTALSVNAEQIKIDYAIGDIDPVNYDAVVFIGGPGMAEITQDDSLTMLAKNAYNAGKITAAICVAPKILARAGILDGRQATAWEGARADLENGGAKLVSSPVAIDGIVITADGPGSAAEFALKITEVIDSKGTQ